jgi:hypothetical protein
MKKASIRKRKFVGLTVAIISFTALLMLWPLGTITGQELILEGREEPPCCGLPPEPPPAAVASEVNGFFLGVEFRRQKGSGGYHDQTFLSWFPSETDGFGRFPTADGNVGYISPPVPIPGSIISGPLPGQVPLHRWSTQKGFYYSINYGNYGGDYVYGGIAGYVWPPGDNRGFPLYQLYSQEYGHFYASYKIEVNCKDHNVTWDDQGEMARVNFPAPLSQYFQGQQCGATFGPFPAPCDFNAVFACQAQGRFFDFSACFCL